MSFAYLVCEGQALFCGLVEGDLVPWRERSTESGLA